MKLYKYSLNRRSLLIIILVTSLILSIFILNFVTGSKIIEAKAVPNSTISSNNVNCSSFGTTYGSITTKINITEAGQYRLWARIKAGVQGADSFYVNIDNSCFVMGNNSSSTGWHWVDYINGSFDKKFDLDVTLGDITITIYGREKGVELDQVMLVGDTARCQESYVNGSSCNDSQLPDDGIVKDVNILGLVPNATIHTASLVQAVPHPSLDVNNVEFYIDNRTIRTDGTEPYCMQGALASECKAYDFTTLTEGQHSFKVVVNLKNGQFFNKTFNFTYQSHNHSGTPIDPETPVVIDPIIVDDEDGTVVKNPDFNGDGSVNIQDLTQLIVYWGQVNDIYDLDGNGTIGIEDLTIVIKSWTNR